MKNNPQTASELMMQSQIEQAEKIEMESLPDCVLPSPVVQKFLLDVIDQTNFPGKMSLFVVQVKNALESARLKADH